MTISELKQLEESGDMADIFLSINIEYGFFPVLAP